MYDTVFTRCRTIIAVVLTWVTGVALDLPNHVGWSSHWFDTKTQKCLWDRTVAYHYTILFVVVGMLLPFVITILCYWRIFAHIRVAKQRILRTQLQVSDNACVYRLQQIKLTVSQLYCDIRTP